LFIAYCFHYNRIETNDFINFNYLIIRFKVFNHFDFRFIDFSKIHFNLFNIVDFEITKYLDYQLNLIKAEHYCLNLSTFTKHIIAISYY
jgi:hypothetical protein